MDTLLIDFIKQEIEKDFTKNYDDYADSLTMPPKEYAHD